MSVLYFGQLYSFDFREQALFTKIYLWSSIFFKIFIFIFFFFLDDMLPYIFLISRRWFLWISLDNLGYL